MILDYTKKTKTREKKEKLFLAQNCLKRIMSQLLDYTKKMTKIEKKIEKVFLCQNCLKRIMILDYTKKTKNREKKRKIIFGSKLSEANNEPTFRLHQKIDKNREKNRTIIFGSELSEPNNEPTSRLPFEQGSTKGHFMTEAEDF